MTEDEIKHRVQRVNAALQENTGLKPEDVEPSLHSTDGGVSFYQDFRGGRSPVQLEGDAAHIINEIMGIRDRAKKWLKHTGGDASQVDDFIRSELAVALVHDLANTDKHGELDYNSMSGCKPSLVGVDRATTMIYDPATGKYATQGQYQGPVFNIQTGEVSGRGSSSGVEVVLISDINDEDGHKIGELQKVLPDAVYKWEQFLTSLGLDLN